MGTWRDGCPEGFDGWLVGCREGCIVGWRVGCDDGCLKGKKTSEMTSNVKEESNKWPERKEWWRKGKRHIPGRLTRGFVPFRRFQCRLTWWLWCWLSCRLHWWLRRWLTGWLTTWLCTGTSCRLFSRLMWRLTRRLIGRSSTWLWWRLPWWSSAWLLRRLTRRFCWTKRWLSRGSWWTVLQQKKGSNRRRKRMRWVGGGGGGGEEERTINGINSIHMKDKIYRLVGVYVGAAVGVRDGPVGCIVGVGLGFEPVRERCCVVWMISSSSSCISRKKSKNPPSCSSCTAVDGFRCDDAGSLMWRWIPIFSGCNFRSSVSSMVANVITILFIETNRRMNNFGSASSKGEIDFPKGPIFWTECSIVFNFFRNGFFFV